MKMRPENVRMQGFLRANGIECNPRYLHEGSTKGCWRLWGIDQPWSEELADKLNSLGFTDNMGSPLGRFSGNGGYFSVLVRGHNELLKG